MAEQDEVASKVLRRAQVSKVGCWPNLLDLTPGRYANKMGCR